MISVVMWHFSILLMCCAILFIYAGAARISSGNSCPVNFDYVENFPEALRVCSQNSTAACCQALLSTFGVGIAENLRQTGGFEFPDNATATACLRSFQTALHENGLAQDFVATCFPSPFRSTSMFITNRNCAGIMTVTDWNRIVGSHELDTSCKGDLTMLSKCQVCNDDVTQAVVKLHAQSNGSSDQQCVYVACLYAAGVVNTFGPTQQSTAACLLGTLTTKASDTKHKATTGMYIGIGVGASILLLAIFGLACFVHRVQVKKRKESSDEITKLPLTGMIQFTFEELKQGTGNFSNENLIGEGGFGQVYRGTLKKYGNMEVAVKVMKNTSTEGSTEFLNEVEVINRVRHRNLVHVIGGCVNSRKDGFRRMLVYDYMRNGSLHDYLFGETKPLLSWPDRRRIAIGMATGINYLHNEVQPAIIHRDIKPSNILLDEDFNARVADFGLAKMSAEEGMSNLTTKVAGTPIYMAIEYALYGQLSEKIDVYSFGIVLLELMSGRKALDTSQKNPLQYHIVDWAWSLVKAGNVGSIIDEKIKDSGSASVMERFVLVGILCAHLMVAYRPTIALALKMLEGDEDIPEIPDRPISYIWANDEDTTPANYSLPSIDIINSSVESAQLLR